MPVTGSQSYGRAPGAAGVWSTGGASQSSLNSGRGNGCCAVARLASDRRTTGMWNDSAILRAVITE